MDAETRHTLAVTDPRAFVRHPFLLVVLFVVVVVVVVVIVVVVVATVAVVVFQSVHSCSLDLAWKFHFRAFYEDTLFPSALPLEVSTPIEGEGKIVIIPLCTDANGTSDSLVFDNVLIFFGIIDED